MKNYTLFFIKRYLTGGGLTDEESDELVMQQYLDKYGPKVGYALYMSDKKGKAEKPEAKNQAGILRNAYNAVQKLSDPTNKANMLAEVGRAADATSEVDYTNVLNIANEAMGKLTLEVPGTGAPQIQVKTPTSKTEDDTKLSDNAKLGIQAAGMVTSAAIQGIDSALTGDKNFSAGSNALDSAVDGAALFASQFGEWGAVAGAGINLLNAASKWGGGTVLGYDVGLTSSGYGSLGKQESKSFRVWDTWSGKLDKELQRRNELVNLALAAANVSSNVEYEQTARMNSVENTIRANQIALAGGTDTSLLAAKRGAKLVRLEEYRKTIKAKEGAKLKNIEVSEEPNVIPEGSYHKNKHNLDLEGITEKGIPVITVEDDSATSLADIQEQESSIVLHAEIERKEPILSLELTEFIEKNRKKWHETKDADICLEVGKRLVKELLFNTKDNAGVIDTIKNLMDGSIL